MNNLAAIVLACSLVLPSAHAQPTDEQITNLVTKMQEAGNAGPDGIDAAAQAAMANMKLDEITLAQIATIAQTRMLDYAPTLAKPIAARLEALAQDKTIAGAAAAELSLQTATVGLDTQGPDGATVYANAIAARVNQVLDHPALAEHLRTPKAGRNLFVAAGMIADADAATLAKNNTIEKLSALITTDLNTEGTAALGALIDPMASAEAGVSPALRLQTLERIQAASSAALARENVTDGKAADPARQRLVTRINDTLTMSKSAFARGELINGPAPEISFTWSSPNAFGSSAVTKLSDLKGKVVLIDFWATWCGPCIRAFPSVRELQARYKDYDVVILGVTSLQGSHTQRKGDQRAKIDTTDNPAREYELMNEFITDMEMTWPVAFSSANVFNPEYGVRGIPHLALIDPAGKVRFNALRPGNPAEEAEKIDALLKEFKLKAPPAPME
ncbi:hypothetical protein LBMAG48_05060 [Phycisphaerae bacterium]|jgi:thiol-disulfide isomerase/thioredoxin|nr:hypothetical protein LBMAG48_05060 [Phycisphaerae bacterium]